MITLFFKLLKNNTHTVKITYKNKEKIFFPTLQKPFTVRSRLDQGPSINLKAQQTVLKYLFQSIDFLKVKKLSVYSCVIPCGHEHTLAQTRFFSYNFKKKADLYVISCSLTILIWINNLFIGHSLCGRSRCVVSSFFLLLIDFVF